MKAPIFIVGSPRSGTTLLAAMMGAHSQLSCGPETHFFRWLGDADIELLTAPADWPDRAADFVSSISRTDFTKGGRRAMIEDYGLDRKEIELSLATCSPSVGAMLSSVAGSFMRLTGKSRWVEKTPDHIEHVAEIRRHFPSSPILRMVRDPRDVALSLTRVPWGVSSVTEGLLFWKSQEDTSSGFFEHDENSLTIRFEDLIARPREALKEIASFIGEVFEESMLDTSRTGKIVNSREVAWKAKASQPIDRSRIEVWRGALTEKQNCLAEALVGDRIEHYEYPRLCSFDRLGEVFPALESATGLSALLETIAAQGVRFWKTTSLEPVSTKVYAGDPAGDHWVDPTNHAKLRTTLAIASAIIGDLLAQRREVYWITSSTHEVWSGWSAFFIKKLLVRHRLA